MSQKEPPKPLFENQEVELENRLLEFEVDWRNAQLNQFQSSVTDQDLVSIFEFIHTDLELRHRRPIDVETYLVAYPELTSDKNRLAELVFAEYRFKTDDSNTPTLGQYLAKFPAIKDELIQFALDQSLFAEDETRTSPEETRSSTSNSRENLLATNDRYRVVEKLDSGGRGTVSLANDQMLDRLVCVKTIKSSLAENDRSKSRFLAEAKLTGRLEHPGILPIYGLGANSDGLPYYAMRLVRGSSLKDRIADIGGSNLDLESQQIAQKELLRHFVQVCNTVEYAHSVGVIHRDLKPANIMVGDYGETFVVDWGLAKRLNTNGKSHSHSEVELTSNSVTDGTIDGTAIGSPSYMSPEQAEGRVEEMDIRTDVFGLGAILHEILFGAPPFGGITTSEVIENARQGKTNQPANANANASTIPKPLNSICQKALAKKKSDRYQNVRQLIIDIERYEAGQRVFAHSEGINEWLQRKVKSNIPMILGIATVSLLVTIASVVSAILINQARQQAVVSEARTKNAYNFIQSVFESPRNKSNVDIKVVDLFDSAVIAAQEHFSEDPLAHAEFLSSAGRVLGHLGDADASISVSKRAYELFRSELGRDNDKTLLNELQHYESLIDSKSFKSAVPQLKELLHEFTLRYGENDRLTLRAINAYGRGEHLLGNYDTASTVLEDGLNGAVETLGERDILTLKLRGNLGWSYFQLEKFEEAERQFEIGSEIRNEIYGYESLQSTIGDYNLASLMFNQFRNMDRVVELAESVLERQRTLVSNESPRITSTMNLLAMAYARNGDFESSLKIMPELVERIASSSGPQSFRAIAARFNLANIYETNDSLEPALQAFRQVVEKTALQMQNKRLAKLHRESSIAEARILLKLGRYEGLIDSIGKQMDFLKDSAKSNNQYEKIQSSQIADAYIKLGEFDAALPYLNQAKDLIQDPIKISDAYIKSLSGKIAQKDGDIETAEKDLLEAAKYMTSKSFTPAFQFFVRETIERLVDLYDETGNQSAKDEWLKKLDGASNKKKLNFTRMIINQISFS